MMRIGITGHQRLDSLSTWDWVERMMRAELSKINQPIMGITSLAVGADQLFARLVLEKNGSLHAVLPYKDIERSFSKDDISNFKALVAKATVEILNTPGSDE